MILVETGILRGGSLPKYTFPPAGSNNNSNDNNNNNNNNNNQWNNNPLNTQPPVPTKRETKIVLPGRKR